MAICAAFLENLGRDFGILCPGSAAGAFVLKYLVSTVVMSRPKGAVVIIWVYIGIL